jgi:hypothetical protein
MHPYDGAVVATDCKQTNFQYAILFVNIVIWPFQGCIDA